MQRPRQPRLPEEFLITGLGQPTLHLHWSVQIQSESSEGLIPGLELADGVYRAMMKVPDIDLKHSPKT